MVFTLFVYNLWWSFRHITGRSTTEINALVSEFDTGEACDYIERNFAAYKLAAGTARFSGRMLEIGPGGSAGVALLALAAGCEAVDLVDRFVVVADDQRMSAVYEELARRHAVDRFRTGTKWDKHSISGISWFEGCSAESYLSRQAREAPGRYSLIASTAVLQDLYDPLAALRDMVTCLDTGGKMIHAVDVRDQGFFSHHNHELTWLTIPSFLWPALTRASGAPNRVLLHRYDALLKELKQKGVIEYSIFVTSIVGSPHLKIRQLFAEIEDSVWEPALREIEKIRPQFTREFLEVPPKLLAVNSFVIVVRKAV
ncbi:methyltransferase domain-containing protein [Methylobacterium planeticum]|nr:methyltransferase domain-containing protein [Methylobacterium planeticum]